MKIGRVQREYIDPRRERLLRWSRSRHLCLKDIEEICESHDFEVRLSLCKNPYAPASALFYLSHKHTEDELLEALIRNPSTPLYCWHVLLDRAKHNRFLYHLALLIHGERVNHAENIVN